MRLITRRDVQEDIFDPETDQAGYKMSVTDTEEYRQKAYEEARKKTVKKLFDQKQKQRRRGAEDVADEDDLETEMKKGDDPIPRAPQDKKKKLLDFIQKAQSKNKRQGGGKKQIDERNKVLKQMVKPGSQQKEWCICVF